MDQLAKQAVSKYFVELLDQFEISRSKLADLMGMSQPYVGYLCNEDYDKITDNRLEYFYEIYSKDAARSVIKGEYPKYEKPKEIRPRKVLKETSLEDTYNFMAELQKLKEAGFEIELIIKTK